MKKPTPEQVAEQCRIYKAAYLVFREHPDRLEAACDRLLQKHKLRELGWLLYATGGPKAMIQCHMEIMEKRAETWGLRAAWDGVGAWRH